MFHDQRLDQAGHPGTAQAPTTPASSQSATTIARRLRFLARPPCIAELDNRLLADIGLTRDDAIGIALRFGKR
jgi:Domain of unknown function (DUF1127)